MSYPATGKLFYHITSTQAARAKTAEERQRLRLAMVTALTALAGRTQRWLDRLSPAQLQQHKDTVLLRRQQRRQRHQTRLRAEAASAAASAILQQPAAAAGISWQAAMAGFQPAAAAAAAAGAAEVQQRQQQGVMSTDLVPMAAAAAAAAAGGSDGSISPLPLSEDARWFLQHYAIFHTQWQSSKAWPSPAYDGTLLEEVAQALYGFSPRWGYN